jgi:hypothetical protein
MASCPCQLMGTKHRLLSSFSRPARISGISPPISSADLSNFLPPWMQRIRCLFCSGTEIPKTTANNLFWDSRGSSQEAANSLHPRRERFSEPDEKLGGWMQCAYQLRQSHEPMIRTHSFTLRRTNRLQSQAGMEHCWCSVRSSKPLRDRHALPWVGSIPTHPRHLCQESI